MSQPRGSQRSLGAWRCNCGCCGFGYSMSFRHFISAKEEQKRLEEYKDQLNKELEGVEERIKKLKGK